MSRIAGGPAKVPLSEIYEQHVWDVYGFLGYRMASREDVEDLTQKTFERAVRAWPRFDPARSSPKTWLIAIARNLLIDHLRATRPAVSLEAEYVSGGADELVSNDPPPDAWGVDPTLADALQELSDREREIIALRFGGDLTAAEIADLMHLSVANVQQIQSRCLRRLRGMLGSRSASVSSETT